MLSWHSSTRLVRKVGFPPPHTHVPVLCPYPATLESHLFLRTSHNKHYVTKERPDNIRHTSVDKFRGSIELILLCADDSKTFKFCISHMTGKFIISIQVEELSNPSDASIQAGSRSSKWAPSLEKITSEAALFFRETPDLDTLSTFHGDI